MLTDLLVFSQTSAIYNKIKIIYSSSVLKIPGYFSNTTYPTRHRHPLHFEIPFIRTNHYKFSYYPRSIRDWNNLPIDTIESQFLEVFLGKL